MDLSVGGHLYGEYSLNANQSIQESFSLNQATDITSLQVGIQPDYGSMYYSYEVTLTGAQGTYNVLDASSWDSVAPSQSDTPLPSILAAGDYTLDFIGGPCMGFCDPASPVYVAGIDDQLPPSYTQIGGSIANGSDFAYTLTGQALAPEPASWALLVSGLLGIPARRYLRHRPQTSAKIAG